MTQPTPPQDDSPQADAPEGAKKSVVEIQQVYYTGLEIENVRCFQEKQKLNLADENGQWARWTLLLGDNGVGKTSLLRGLLLLSPVQDGDLISPFFFKIFPVGFKFLLRDPEKKFQIAATYESGGVRSDISCSGTGSRAHGQEIFFPIYDESGGEFSVEWSYGKDGRSGKGITFRDNGRHVKFKYTGLMKAYSANRFLDKEKGSVEDIGNDNHLLTEDIPLINPEKWLLRADYAARIESPFQERARARMEMIKQTLTDLLPDVEEIRIAPPQKLNEQPRTEFKTPYGWVRFDGLSLGYRAMMGWVVDLAARMFDHYPESPNPLAEPAVVLVDEIDLHLHPKWQRRIMGYLSERFPQTQFIATAHSPLIAQAADDRTNIAVLRREGDHVVIDNNPENVRNWRVDQILSSDLFGVPLRSEEVERLMAERARILSKSRLSAQDKSRLRQLEEAIGEPPVGESKADREAMAILRAAAAHLKPGA
ncbi:MAG: AAA family ATPase [Magnetococcales bacterium]|nr:AAA family ATPase [Magnetococcales bacterium]